MMTSSNGNIFRVTGPLCGEFTGPGEFPAQRPVTRSFDVFFDLRLNKWLSKQPWGWWFETPSWSLWRQCNVKSAGRHLQEDKIVNCIQNCVVTVEVNRLMCWHHMSHWQCANHVIVPMAVKQPWSIWVNMLHDYTKNCIMTKTKQNYLHISWNIPHNVLG